MDNSHEQIGKMIQELIMHEIDVVTESDWFLMLIDERIKIILEERLGE